MIPTNNHQHSSGGLKLPSRCVFLRNGRSASQPHIELFALLTFALPRCIKSKIADFIAPGMAAQLHSPVSTTDPLRQKMGCVLQLCNGATAEVTKCQFGANGVVAHTQLNGPWYRWRADAPHILASENVTADGRQVQIACTLDAHRRDTLARLEAHRDREGMGLAPWGVSPEEEQEILRREVERNQPPWLEEWICSFHQSTMKHYYCVCLFGGKTMKRLKPEVEFTYVFEFLVHAGKLVGRTPKILGMAQDDSKTEIIEDLWISFKLKTMIKS